ncbi:MAG: F0F1 ATP synthase subunit A [Alphaproteobacteria bacterium]|nr:F0F1 ATP synthase subunit A [Alphaproteobacteria bacterium]
MASNPMDQFTIVPIVPLEVAGFDISFTNSALWMTITVVVSSLFLLLSIRSRGTIPTRGQMVAEMMYNTVANMVRDNVGSGGQPYFPFIFTLFMFVLFGNLLGMVPGSFTFTSHIAVTFAMAAIIFIAVTVIGIAKHGTRFATLFFPHGAPLWTAVILIPIELVSYLSRPVSLSVRIFANLTVGHVILKVIAGFVVALGVFGIVPLAGLVAITAFEFMIAVIQAYVFAILSCIYLHDALHLH